MVARSTLFLSLLATPTLASLLDRLFSFSLPLQRILSATFSSSFDTNREIQTFVALGDSYSAGIGTPIPGGDGAREDDCRRGSGAYPYLLSLDLLPPANDSLTNQPFQWLSCTGSTTDDLLASPQNTSQIDALIVNPSSPPAFATLSIGGNDLGFFDVMNACVFRFYSFYSGTCEAALAASDAAIASPEFEMRLALILGEILDRVRWEVRPEFSVTVTGYARFFDDETEACDDVSLGVWWGGGVGGRGPKLKREVRRRMNELVREVNAKIERAVAVANGRFVRPKVVFVDYDGVFEGHRFCEEGVNEPDYQRGETWFFLPGTVDSGRDEQNETATTAGAVLMNMLPKNSPLVDPKTCLGPAQRSGDWGELALCYMAMAKKREPTLRLREGMAGTNAMWYVPTYYGKTFHPVSISPRLLAVD